MKQTTIEVEVTTVTRITLLGEDFHEGDTLQATAERKLAKLHRERQTIHSEVVDVACVEDGVKEVAT